MRNLLFIAVLALLSVSCNNAQTKDAGASEAESSSMKYQAFGDMINDENVLSKIEIQEKYSQLKAGDTLDVKFRSDVNSVCQNKGCWMRMDMGEQEAMVKFKDYGFFMPKDLTGEVIVEGKAFVEEVSVDEQRHYAEDAGKTSEEIAAITEPKRTLSFISNGVLIPVKEAPKKQ